MVHGTTASFRLYCVLSIGQPAGSDLADTASMKLARRGDYSGFVREMDGLIRQKKLDELMAEYEKHAENFKENNLDKLIEKARNSDRIELTEDLECVVAGKKFEEIEALRGKLSNRAVRKWYVAQDARIKKELDSDESLEQSARKAFNMRNENRMHARALMQDQEKRAMLDRDEPNKTFEELLADKMNRKGLTREEAMKDIIDTAGKTRRSVNKSLGLE